MWSATSEGGEGKGRPDRDPLRRLLFFGAFRQKFEGILETEGAKAGSPGRTRTSDQRINSPSIRAFSPVKFCIFPLRMAY